MAEQPQTPLATRAVAEHHVVGERVDPLQPLVGVLAAHLLPCVTGLVHGRDRCRHQPELDGVVVGDQQQPPPPAPAGTLGSRDMLGPVEDAGAATAHRPWLRLGPVGVDDPALAGVPALAPDQHLVAAAAAPQVHREPLVGFAEHEGVVGRGGADPVPPDLMGAGTQRRARCRSTCASPRSTRRRSSCGGSRRRGPVRCAGRGSAGRRPRPRWCRRSRRAGPRRG